MLKPKNRAIIAGDIATLEEINLAERKLQKLGVLQKTDQVKLINTVKALWKHNLKEEQCITTNEPIVRDLSQ